MKSIVCKNQARPLIAAAALNEPLDLFLDLREWALQSFAPRIDDNRPLRIQPTQPDAEGFAQTPADSIARDRFSESARRGETNVRGCKFGQRL